MNPPHTTSLKTARQLQNIRAFVSVADAESVSKAAGQLFKAPSAVTRSIIELERLLRVALFDRKPRGMQLNIYGRAVLVRAQRIRDELRTATEGLLASFSAGTRPSPTAVNNLLFNGRKLLLLINLVDFRSVSLAGAQMRLTQAGVSMALARIESIVGEPLFIRKAEGLAPTAATEQLAMHARRVIAELRHLESDISSVSGSLAGSVVIGTTPLGRTHLFPMAIAKATSSHPGLRITTVESMYDELITSLRNGDIDLVIGVVRPRNLSRGLITEPLLTDRLSIVVRAGHPLLRREGLKLSDLMEERWILPRRPLVDASFRNHGLAPPDPTIETGDLAIVKQLLYASDMIAVTSPLQLGNQLQSGSLVELPVVLSGTNRQVGITRREGAMLSPAALAVLDEVRSHVRSRRAGGKKR
jgi:LysR family transcriptional regulator of gallate degradation